jgi:hypothetical protein
VIRSRRAWLVACVVAAAPALWLAWEIDREIGLPAFSASRKEWLSSPGLYLLPMTAKLVARSLSEWVSPVVLGAAFLGLALMIRRRSPGDLLVLVWLALFLATMPLYRFYPRLLVPVLPAVALAAGTGIDALARAVAPSWARGRAAVLGAVLLAPGFLASGGALAVEDRGYALAGRFLAQAPRSELPDVLVTQHSLLFYLAGVDRPFVCYDQPGAFEALESGRFRYLVGDVRLLHAPEFRAFLDAHADDLKLVAEIGNPLPEPTIVNNAGFEGLDALRDPDADPEFLATLKTIRVWRPRQGRQR